MRFSTFRFPAPESTISYKGIPDDPEDLAHTAISGKACSVTCRTARLGQCAGYAGTFTFPFSLSGQALPLCARAAWDVLRDSFGMAMSESKVRPTWSGIPLDALPNHITKKIFQVLSPGVQREYMDVAATEAAGYISYRRLRTSLGKPRHVGCSDEC